MPGTRLETCPIEVAAVADLDEAMNEHPPDSYLSVGECLRMRREELYQTQSAVARQARVSIGYYSGIENGRMPPPPEPTLIRILEALSFDQSCVTEIMHQAALERGVEHADVGLPPEARDTIDQIRRNATILPPRFLHHLAVMVREAVAAKK